jgi:hypothetical protein
MERRARVLVFLSCLAVLILLGIVFQRFVLSAVIQPAATAVWLFLRLFVLSIGQAVYWWGAICLALIAALFHLARGWTLGDSRPPLFAYATRDQVSHWRTSILRGEIAAAAADGDDAMRRDLMWLFTGMHASQMPGSVKFKIREALQKRLIPLPETIYSFLYAQRRPEPRPSFIGHPVLSVRRSLRSARDSLVAWFNNKTGRARTHYLASIEEVVAFMETFLETKHDDTASRTRDS